MNSVLCDQINCLNNENYVKPVIHIDLKHYFKNYEYKNNKELKETVRKNAKQIRDVIVRNTLFENKDHTYDTIKNNAMQNSLNEDKDSLYFTNNGIKNHNINKFTKKKKKKGLLYIDNLYTKLIRHLYTLFSLLNLEKKKKKKFDFNKVYTYKYNYKKLTTNEAMIYINKLGISDVKIADVDNSTFFTYCNKLDIYENNNKSNFNICLYLPTKKELDIIYIMEKLYDYFYFYLFVPITIKEERLIFFPFNIINNLLVKHHFNIYVPYLYIHFNLHKKIPFNLNKFNIITNKLLDYEYKENEILFIIPLIAYNKYGCRIGSGKGYYDRTLKKNENSTEVCKNNVKSPIKISVSSEVFLYDLDFSEFNDITLDYIINEKNIYHFLF